ncbi:MAG: hypothetical protein ABIQ11_07670, partial [Saprospiraceae bacterium]
PTRAMIPNAMINKVRMARNAFARTDLTAWDRFSLNCMDSDVPDFYKDTCIGAIDSGRPD